ncbi:protein with putative role during mitosis [Gaertneriomyces sp. JEL0708]|nr:protein with putative role during mitosis [Gaertneriomyces sp. JEL0708]
MNILTPRQETELRLALLDYLHTHNLPQTAELFAQEAAIQDFVNDGKQRYSGLLEKKWGSLVRLQKKIMDQEETISALRAELQSHPRLNRAVANGLPESPALHTLSGHRGPITSLSLHPTTTLLATSSEDTTIKLWDYETGEFERTLKGHTKPVTSVAFSPDGVNLASCSNDVTVKVWDLEGRCLRTMYGHDHSVSWCGWAGSFVVSAGRDGTLRLWDEKGVCVKTVLTHQDWVRCGDVDTEGRWLLTGGTDKSLRVWDATNGDCRAEMRGHEHYVECVTFVPREMEDSIRALTGAARPKMDDAADQSLPPQYAISGSRDRTIKIFDTTTQQCVYTLEGHDNWVRSLATISSAKSRYLVSVGDDKQMKVWDLSTGKCAKQFKAADHFVNSIAVGKGVVVTGDTEESARVWAVK